MSPTGLARHFDPPALGQIPIGELPSELWDVLVVGAGPAGAATALLLSSKGHRVALVDGAAFPRDKICGDGLLAEAMEALDQLGALDEVRAVGHSIRATVLHSPSGHEVELGGDFLTVRRRLLDAILARKAVEAGVVFALGAVKEIQIQPDQTLTARSPSSRTPLRARCVVLATGARRSLHRRSGLGPARSAPRPAVAVRCYVQSGYVLDRMIIAYDRAILPGYAWIFPLGNGTYNVGCGVFPGRLRRDRANPLEVFDRFRNNFPLARDILEFAHSVGPLSGAPLRFGLRGASPLGPGKILAVGEAVNATCPLTGEGVACALQTATLASHALHEYLVTGDPGALRLYPKGLVKLRKRHRAYETGARWLSSTLLSDFLALRAIRSSSLRASVARVLAGEASPRQVFSVAGVLRSYLS